MAYTSSSQSSISSLSRKEDISRFEYNVTSPILESKKNKKKKIGKLVDQVKKFKKQAPKIHDDASNIHSDDMGYHSNNDPIFIFDAKETETVVACTTGTEFFESKAPMYKSNYSEKHHHHHKFLSKIKKYHSSHLHLVTSMIQSDDGEEEDEDELEEAQEKDVKIQHQHRHKHDLKMIRSNKKYFKRKKKPKDQTSVYYFSSVLSSTTTTTSSHKRKRLHINLTNKRKRQQHGKRVPIATTKPAESAANEQERKSSLIQIRHQMIDFKIPADWTCISSKVNKRPTTTTTNFSIIQDTTLLDQKIDSEIKRIEASKSVIEDYIRKIQQLNVDIETRDQKECNTPLLIYERVDNCCNKLTTDTYD